MVIGDSHGKKTLASYMYTPDYDAPIIPVFALPDW
jgi:hypothetical protein